MRIAVHVFGAILAIAAISALAQAPEVQTISSGCTTKETGGDGVRHGCDSEPTVLSAPEGFVFAEKSLKGGETSGAGSEHECRLSWSEYVEVIPGTAIEQPRKVTLVSHARGPKGHFSGRGWSKCSYTVKLTKYTPK